MSTRI
jgi:hypothetical protein